MSTNRRSWWLELAVGSAGAWVTFTGLFFAGTAGSGCDHLPGTVKYGAPATFPPGMLADAGAPDVMEQEKTPSTVEKEMDASTDTRAVQDAAGSDGQPNEGQRGK